MDGNFGKSIVGRESKSLSRVPVYSREKTDLPLPWWKCYQPAVRGQLVSLGSGTSRGLSDGLCCWQCGTQGGQSHSSLCEWTSTLLSPRITSILGAVAPLFKSPCDMAMATGREAVGHSRSPSSPSLMKLPFAKPSHETQIHSHSVSIGEVSPRVSSHLVVTFPSVFPPNLWPSSQMDSHCSGKLWPYFLPGRMNNEMLYLKFCLLGGFPLSSLYGAVGLQLPSFGWYQPIVHDHSHKRPEFSSLTQLVSGYSSRGLGCGMRCSSAGAGELSHWLMQHTCALRICVGLI